MKFYAECLEAHLKITSFGETRMPWPESAKERVMYARITKGPLMLVASDILPGKPFKQGNNFSVLISAKGIEEIEKLFIKFSKEGSITMPLQETFWAIRFGTLTDQFGVNWMFSFDKSHH